MTTTATTEQSSASPNPGAAEPTAAPATGTPPKPAQRLYGSRVLTVEMILIAIFSLVDVILLKGLADVVVNDNSGGGILSWTMAVGVSGIGLVIAAGAGMMRHEEKRGYRATFAAWLMIGVTVALMRALTGEFTGHDIKITDGAQAVLMLFLYIAAGWRMAMIAPEVLSSERHELATAKRVRDRSIGGRLARLEERYARHYQAARRCDDARAQVDQDLEHVETLISADRDRLYALARNEITKVLVDPESSSEVYRSPVAARHHDHPGHGGTVLR